MKLPVLVNYTKEMNTESMVTHYYKLDQLGCEEHGAHHHRLE